MTKSVQCRSAKTQFSPEKTIRFESFSRQKVFANDFSSAYMVCRSFPEEEGLWKTRGV